MNIKRHFRARINRAMFDQKSALIELLIAVERRDTKWIALDHYVPGLVTEQLVRRTGHDPQAGSQFYYLVFRLYPAPDQFSFFLFVFTLDEARPVSHGCNVPGDRKHAVVCS